jgi:hypothetical protein
VVTYWIDFCGKYNAKTVTISGTPTFRYLYNNNFRTYYCTAATISGTVTRNLASTIVLTSGTQSPTVCSGTAITTVYTFGGSATDDTVSDLPTGLTSVVSAAAKTVTISGTQLLRVHTITTSGHTAPCTAQQYLER